MSLAGLEPAIFCTSLRRFSESTEKAKPLSTEPAKWSKGANSWPCGRCVSWQDRIGELRFRKLAEASISWSRGVTVSTLDSESSDRGSHPRGTFFVRHRVMSVGGHSQAGPNRTPTLGWYLMRRESVGPKPETWDRGRTKLLFYRPATCLEAQDKSKSQACEPPAGASSLTV